MQCGFLEHMGRQLIEHLCCQQARDEILHHTVLQQLSNRMLALSLIEEEGEVVHLTLLGKACGESVLSFSSAMRLVELLKSYPTSTLRAENFMALVQALPESDKSHTPMIRKGNAEAVRVREAVNIFGSEVVQVLQRFT